MIWFLTGLLVGVVLGIAATVLFCMAYVLAEDDFEEFCGCDGEGLAHRPGAAAFKCAAPAREGHRCQAIKGTDERADEYIICGAIAPFDDTRGPVEAWLCAAHHQLFESGVGVKVSLGHIGMNGVIGVWKRN